MYCKEDNDKYLQLAQSPVTNQFLELTAALSFDDNEDKALIKALSALLPLLDQHGLKHLNLCLPQLSLEHSKDLVLALTKVQRMKITFKGSVAIEQAISLEGINDAQLAIKVPYYQQTQPPVFKALLPSYQPIKPEIRLSFEPIRHKSILPKQLLFFQNILPTEEIPIPTPAEIDAEIKTPIAANPIREETPIAPASAPQLMPVLSLCKNDLTQVDLPSKTFYVHFCSESNRYQAWNYWSKTFIALNALNLEGIKALLALLDELKSRGTEDRQLNRMDYALACLNYYYQYQTENQTLTNKLLIHGFENARSQFKFQIETITPLLRSKIYHTIKSLLTDKKYINAESEITKSECRQLLWTYVQNQWNNSERNKQLAPALTKPELFKLLDSFGYLLTFKIMELACTCDFSVVYNVFMRLKELHEVWGQTGIDDFNKTFVIPSVHIAELAHAPQQQAFTQLMQLSAMEYHWWQHLTQEHKGYVNFAEFMSAFQNFLNDLERLDLRKDLYAPCPLKGMKHVPNDLKKVILVLDMASKTKEQWRNLQGLNWSATIENHPYHFICAEMFLDTSKKPHLQSVVDFYRFIGAQKYAAPVAVYRDLLAHLQLPTNYVFTDTEQGISSANLIPKTQIISKLLPIIAHTNTGAESLEQMPKQASKRRQQVQQFVKSLYQAAEITDSKSKVQNKAQISLQRFSSLLETLSPGQDGKNSVVLALDVSRLRQVDNFIHNLMPTTTVHPTPKSIQVYDNDVIWPYLRTMDTRSEDGKKHPIENAAQYYMQFCTINSLGFNEFKNCTLDQVRDRIHAERQKLANTTGAAEKEAIILTGISLIREAVYLQTFYWPTPEQMLALLINVNNVSLYLQIPAQNYHHQGSMLLALMTWFQSGPVTIISRNSPQNAALFQQLHIDDIYYSTFENFALTHQINILENKKEPDKMAFIIEDAHDSLFQSDIVYQLAQAESHEIEHAHAWVFEALAEYFSKNTDMDSVFETPIEAIIIFLNRFNPLAHLCTSDPEFLAKLPAYAHATWQAMALNNKEDYLVHKKYNSGNDYYAAVLDKDSTLPLNGRFGGLLQQGLHGYLNYKSKQENSLAYFPVPTEPQIFSTMNAHAVFNYMCAKGKVVLLSPIYDQNHALFTNNPLKVYKIIDPYQAKYTEYPERYTPNQNQQFSAIASICLKYTNRTQYKKPCIIIAVASIAIAEKLGAHLSSQHSELPGQYLNEKSFAEVEWYPGLILIAVHGLIERRIEALSETARQVLMINTCFHSKTSESLLKAFFDYGKYYAVYNTEYEMHWRNNSLYPVEVSELNNFELFKMQSSQALNFIESNNLVYRLLVGSTYSLLQDHFQKILAENPTHRAAILTQYTYALSIILNSNTCTTESKLSNIITPLIQNHPTTSIDQYLNALHAMAIVNDSTLTRQQLYGAIDTKIQYLLQTLEKIQGAEINKLVKPRIFAKYKPGANPQACLDASNAPALGFFMNLFFSHTNYPVVTVERRAAVERKMVRKDRNQINIYDSVNYIAQRLSSIPNIPNTQPIPASSSDQSYFRIGVCRWGAQGQVSIIHDIQENILARIEFESNDIRKFYELDPIIKHYYKLLCFRHPLPLTIHSKVKDGVVYYSVQIDLSSHDYDYIDRSKFINIIFNQYFIKLSQSGPTHIIPSLTTMQKIVTELGLQFPHLKLDRPVTNLCRTKYFEACFSPLMRRLNKNDLDQNAYWQAFSSSHETIEYQTISGYKCEGYLAAFVDLNSLLENHKKRLAIAAITRSVLSMQEANLYRHSSLVLQQAEYLQLLAINIIQSQSTETLASIITHWKDKPIVFRGNACKLEDLMEHQEISHTFFSQSINDLHTQCLTQIMEMVGLNNPTVSTDLRLV